MGIKYFRITSLDIGTAFKTKDGQVCVVTKELEFTSKGATRWEALNLKTNEMLSDYRSINVTLENLTPEEEILALPYTV